MRALAEAVLGASACVADHDDVLLCQRFSKCVCNGFFECRGSRFAYIGYCRIDFVISDKMCICA